MTALYLYSLQPVSSYVAVKYRLHNIDTDEITIVMELDNGEQRIEKEFQRIILSKTEVKQLLLYGVKFLESSCDKLLEYLLRTEAEAVTLHTHTNLGWDTIDGQSVFKCQNILCNNDSKFQIDSGYNGVLDIASKGNLDVWLTMVQKEVLKNTPLTVCLLLGFAAPIFAFLTERFDLGTLIFSLVNDSSKGKSTAAALATSVFSNPVLNCGTLRSFNATQNFLVTFLSQSSGLLIALDEGAAYSGDFQQLLYLLSSGTEKSRLDGNRGMKSDKSWRSIVMTTAEFDLTSDDTSPNGIRARCFRITDSLTASAENSDNIKTIVADNYALSGSVFIQWIINHKLSCLVDDYLEAKKILLEEKSRSSSQPSPLTQRILSKLAVILQTANYVSECFCIDIDVPQIMKYLLSIEQVSSKKTNLAANALDILTQEISRNSAKYLTPDSPCSKNAVGKITEDGSTKTISILKNEFQLICKRNNFQNLTQILKELKKTGVLQTEPDRLTRRVRLSPELPEVTCYVFKISDPKCQRKSINSDWINQNRKLTDPMLTLSNNDIDFD